MTQPDERVWPRGTVEYLEATVTADVVIADDDPVAFTFDRETFHTAEWTGIAGNTRTCRVLLDDTLLPAAPASDVYVRVTDNPEIPLIPAGTLLIV